jgi:antitoxin MazE
VVKQHIRKWGNSDAVRLPASVLSAAGLKVGDPVLLRAERGRIVIENPALSGPTLDELLEGITPENCHEAFDWGPPVGKEIW